MTKLILAGVAALALSTGAALAANNAQPVADYSNAPVHDTQSTQRYAYMPQQGSQIGYTAQNAASQSGGASASADGFTSFSGSTPFGSGGNG